MASLFQARPFSVVLRRSFGRLAFFSAGFALSWLPDSCERRNLPFSVESFHGRGGFLFTLGTCKISQSIRPSVRQSIHHLSNYPSLPPQGGSCVPPLLCGRFAISSLVFSGFISLEKHGFCSSSSNNFSSILPLPFSALVSSFIP